MAQTFSVHDGSLLPTMANVCGIWWQNVSSAGMRGPVGFIGGTLLTDTS